MLIIGCSSLICLRLQFPIQKDLTMERLTISAPAAGLSFGMVKE
jgi:hypothetical protein